MVDSENKERAIAVCGSDAGSSNTCFGCFPWSENEKLSWVGISQDCGAAMAFPYSDRRIILHQELSVGNS